MATATRTKVAAKRSSKYLKEALYSGRSSRGRASAKQLEDFLKSRERAFKCEHADRAVRKWRSHGRICVPSHEAMSVIMAYVEEKKDVAAAEQFIELQQKGQKDLGVEVFNALGIEETPARKKSPDGECGCCKGRY